MTTELALSNEALLSEIQGRQNIIELAKINVKMACLESANAIREAGIYLLQLKEQTPHGEWLSLFEGRENSTPVLNFTDQTARRYMQFAKANPEPFISAELAIGAYKEIYKSTGLIESGDSTGNAKRVTPSDGWMSTILDAVTNINRIVDKHSISEAPAEVKDAFIERVKPVVRLFFEAGGRV
jgi:hypothetical protein